jgi:flagellar biosynthesis protein FliP
MEGKASLSTEQRKDGLGMYRVPPTQVTVSALLLMLLLLLMLPQTTEQRKAAMKAV